MYTVMVRLIVLDVTLRSLASALRAGRYMLDETGEMKAAKEASMMVRIFSLSWRVVCGGSSSATSWVGGF
jgi:hypothetical protein